MVKESVSSASVRKGIIRIRKNIIDKLKLITVNER
jgi:hypothetical protein